MSKQRPLQIHCNESGFGVTVAASVLSVGEISLKWTDVKTVLAYFVRLVGASSKTAILTVRYKAIRVCMTLEKSPPSRAVLSVNAFHEKAGRSQVNSLFVSRQRFSPAE
jgi:hypothetical protein